MPSLPIIPTNVLTQTNMRKILLSFLILILVGCSATDSTISDIPEEQAINKKTIVTSFYPLHFIAEKVVGENLIVENITKGKDPHSYSLTPKDIQALQDADLFVFQGAGLESWAEDIAENRTSPSFEVAENIDLLPTEESHSSENHKDDDHDDHEDHEEDGDNHDHHDHGAFDPHTWLDPMLLQETAQKLTQESKIYKF
jgi:zinc transport system substrate-binding protein